MSEIMAEVLRLDGAGQHQDIVAYLLRHSNDPGLLLSAVAHLLKNQRFEAAIHLSNALVHVGVDHPISQLGRAIGGLIANNQDVLAESTAAVGRHYNAMTPEHRAMFYAEFLNPAMFQMASLALQTDDQAALLRVLDLLKTGSPVLQRIFDWSAEPSSVAAGDRPSPILNRSPPEGAPRLPRRTVVALRDKVFPQNPSSRILDTGPRFAHAAAAYGWPSHYCPLAFQNIVVDFQAMIDHCRAFEAEVLIFDDHGIQSDVSHPFRRQMLAQLREALPSIKIVSMFFDSWEIAPEVLREAASDVDAIWATTPSLPLWNDPAFQGKLMQAPLAHGGNLRAPDEAAPAKMSFVGGLMGYNWHRAFWRAASIRDGMPIEWHLSSHMVDGLPPLESYAQYMQRLAATGCSLNLAMRSDLSYIITDRTFEALLTGTLLVQEEAADIDYFFVAGEHYLPFSSYSDLRAVADLVVKEPERVQAIRRAGHDFAVSRYADDKLIGYLDAILFHPSPSR